MNPGLAQDAQDPPPVGSLALLTDKELVERYYGGDGDAFDLLYVRYHSSHIRMAIKILGSESVAEEVVEHAWNQFFDLRAYDAARGEFAHWMVTLVKRRCLDMLRKAGWRKTIPSEEAILFAPEPMAEDSAIWEQFLEAYRGCRDYLTVTQRAVWICRMELNLTCVETQLRSSVVVGSQTKCLKQAVTSLKNCLEHKGFQEPPEICYEVPYPA
jgi:RNA polymerase sigma-70 factor (ECF subfamily)